MSESRTLTADTEPAPAAETGTIPRSQLNAHRAALLIALGIIVLACLLQVRPDQRVEFRILPGCALPHSCYSRSLLQIDCPGCGLTRSFIYLAEGRWSESFQVHRLGWLLAFIVVIQLPYRWRALRTEGRAVLPPQFLRWFVTTLLILLFANWILKLIW